ncbi:MAG: hypothetical protein H7039_04145, partial [Bryobacteraceae bacterium]|nr:hypothetical protein [Bryobacteraceae bacterium]
SGMALQANYGYKIFETPKLAGSLEFHFLANGQRKISSANQSTTRDLATLYATPGFRLKFMPGSKIAPYAVFGGGYALYEQSFFQLSGSSNTAPRFTHRGTIMYGGGVDLPLWKFIGLRAEVRDFYSGSPSYNTSADAGRQHNVVLGGGFVLRFR